MCERNHPATGHLKRFVPFCLAGLLMGAACGAPDEVKRVTVQTGGQPASSGGAGAGSSEAVSSSSSAGGSAMAGSSAAIPSGGKSSSGGATASGGKGGSSSVGSKGGSSAAGALSSSGKSSSAGGSGGVTTYPPVGGATGGSTGGATAGTTSTTTTPAPTSGLAVKVTKAIAGNPGSIAFSLQIENKNTQTAEMAAVTMRYWYAEESLGATLVLASDYVSVGYSNKGKVTAVKSVANSSGGVGADHYLEFSFDATLAAKGDKDTNDLFTVNVTVHNSGYSGKVDLTNDYSYNAGATGYNEKITLHGGGKVIYGTPPGEGGGEGPPPSPDVDAGAVDANATH